MESFGFVSLPGIIANKTLLRLLRIEFKRGRMRSDTRDKPWFDDRYYLAHRAKQRAYRVCSPSRTHGD